MTKIAIVLVEQQLLADALSSLLAATPSVSVVGTATSGAEALELLERLQPDVLVTGHALPDLPIVQFIHKAKAQRRETEIVVVGRDLDDNLAVTVMRAGATAFILQDISGENFIKVITAAARGRAVVHPQLLRTMMRRLTTPVRAASSQPTLTRREQEIITEVVTGSTDKGIARKLRLSEFTVKAHVRSILRKLGVRNRTEAVSRLLRTATNGGSLAGGYLGGRTRVRHASGR